MAKYKKQFNNMTGYLGLLVNRSIRTALAAGVEAAIRTTVHDSSNAGYHWMVAEQSKSRPGNRKLGTVKDLRETQGVRGIARAATPPVGARDSKGKHKPRTVIAARMRERAEVIDKMVAGRTPTGRFYFYHGLQEGRTNIPDAETYHDNANIEAAGRAAVEATHQVFIREMAKGRTRKGPRA